MDQANGTHLNLFTQYLISLQTCYAVEENPFLIFLFNISGLRAQRPSSSRTGRDGPLSAEEAYAKSVSSQESLTVERRKSHVSEQDMKLGDIGKRPKEHAILIVRALLKSVSSESSWYRIPSLSCIRQQATYRKSKIWPYRKASKSKLRKPSTRAPEDARQGRIPHDHRI